MSKTKSSSRHALLDRTATSVAVLASGAWVGGLVALGACAAPFVFRLTPAPFSGDAMGSAFARFDQFALGAAVIMLGCEVVRTWVGRAGPRTLGPRLRRVVAIAMAVAGAYVGLALTPRIMELHRSGARRGEGAEGAELERVHRRAEAVGKAEVALGIALIALHVFTLGARRREEEENEDDARDEAQAPLPPGPG